MDPDERKVPTSVSLPMGLLKRVDASWKKKGFKDRSEFIAHALTTALEREGNEITISEAIRAIGKWAMTNPDRVKED